MRPSGILKRRLPLENQGVPRGRTAEDDTLRDCLLVLQFEGVRPLCHDASGLPDRASPAGTGYGGSSLQRNRRCGHFVLCFGHTSMRADWQL